MRSRTAAMVVLALALGAVGCSSPGPATLSAGELPAGTAQVTVNGTNVGVGQAVRCDHTDWLTTIATGDDTSGLRAVVASGDGLAVRTVDITNLGGFTGSYHAGLGGAVKAGMTGATYDISGTAEGYNTAEPSFRAGGTFAIRVTC